MAKIYRLADVQLALRNSGARSWRDLFEYLNYRARENVETSQPEIQAMAYDAGKLYRSGQDFPSEAGAVFEMMASV
jgi:hypothetical protein